MTNIKDEILKYIQHYLKKIKILIKLKTKINAKFIERGENIKIYESKRSIKNIKYYTTNIM